MVPDLLEVKTEGILFCWGDDPVFGVVFPELRRRYRYVGDFAYTLGVLKHEVDELSGFVDRGWPEAFGKQSLLIVIQVLGGDGVNALMGSEKLAGLFDVPFLGFVGRLMTPTLVVDSVQLLLQRVELWHLVGWLVGLGWALQPE